MTHSFRVTVSPSLNDFPEWPGMLDLGRSVGYCFQGRDFLEVWLQTIGRARGTLPAFVTVEDRAGRLAMRIPLGIERSSGLRRLVFLDGGVVDYNAPILGAPEVVVEEAERQELWDAIVRRLPPFDVAVLEKMPADVLGRHNPLALRDSGRDRRSGHVLNLDGTWETYAAHELPRRQDSRRKRRQIAAIGPVRLVVADTDDEAARLLAEMVRQKTRRYLETLGEDQFERPGYRLYFPAMTERFRSTGIVQVAAVYVGDTIIATHWGIVAHGRFHYLMPTFEAGDWGRFSPGRILIEELVAWSYGKGLHAFDFGPGDEPFKDEFSNGLVPLLRMERPYSLLGRTQQSLVKGRRTIAASPLGPMIRNARTWLATLVKR